MESDKAEKTQVRGRWPKGVSGNPKGCAKGSRHKVTQAVQALLDGEAEGLTRKAVEAAMGGDMVALRLCLERICPAPKDRPLRVKLPEVKGASDLPGVTGAILDAVASGELTPSEGQAVAGLVEAHRKSLEMQEIELRVQALENHMGGGK
ncbi:MAG: DUF5681 domain-containing protein [Desulfovibrionaceae bacterium]|nr:DUF5681 domain-containing protein [Desulfovibrionaceae bacterium]